MKQDQYYTPKYWVVHDKSSDDVFMWTASKIRQEAIELFDHSNRCSVDFDYNELLECILIEVRMMSEDY